MKRISVIFFLTVVFLASTFLWSDASKVEATHVMYTYCSDANGATQIGFCYCGSGWRMTYYDVYGEQEGDCYAEFDCDSMDGGKLAFLDITNGVLDTACYDWN